MHDISGPAVAVTLRAIAAWLESHPEATVHQIDFIGSPVQVSWFALRSREEIDAAAAALGGEWHANDDEPDDTMCRLVQHITPDVLFVITSTRAQLAATA